MSYSSNQYNYATPLSSSNTITVDAGYAEDAKYFTLHNNKLDGNYKVVAGDAGLWGAVLSDSNGNLSTPYVLTVEDSLRINAIRIVGSQYSYPVAFTVQIYNGTTLLQTVTETANTSVTYIKTFPSVLVATKYVVTITKISAANETVRIFNAYNPGYVKRAETLKLKETETTWLSTQRNLFLSDSLSVGMTDTRRLNITTKATDSIKVTGEECASCTHPRIVNIVSASDDLKSKVTGETTRIQNVIDVTEDTLDLTVVADRSRIVNMIDVTRDTLRPKVTEDISSITNIIDVTRDTLKVLADPLGKVTNIHTVMKEPTRSIVGKVYITYVDPMLMNETQTASSGEAHNSRSDQVLDGIAEAEDRYFTLYENDLAGNYPVGDAYSQVGWVSSTLSKADGTFDEDIYFTLSFSERPISGFNVVFDAERGIVAKDFTITFNRLDEDPIVYTYTDNEDVVITIDDIISEVLSIRFDIQRINQANKPAVIMDIPTLSTFLYKGYKDASDLISVDLLEELTYEDEVEALGGVSANEITVVLDNSNRDFFFNNSRSPIARQLKRNRRIVPWLGAEITPGEIEWYTLGTFWSHSWSVPVDGLTATVVGFDTIGMLSTTMFTEHQTMQNKSIGELIEVILEDAKTSLDFIEYEVEDALYSVVIPFAWFANDSHAAALRKIAGCYPVHMYCDRNGVIQCKLQKLHLDYYYDTWSDHTNVISKTYSSLYTTVPNLINVNVKQPLVAEAQQLVTNDVPFSVSGSYNMTLAFSNPYLDNIEVNVTCDETVSYSYATYSWGIVMTFTGTGDVSHIECLGDCVDTSNTSIRSGSNQDSIRLDGVVKRDVDSDFIQTTGHADVIINRILGLSQYDKYDATVEYRGDISLTINDPILLQGGIAPDNRYNIKRHELSWNGALTGSAELNT